MKNSWIILDMSYLGYRSHYALGMLRHGDQPTAVIFGILREMRSLAYRYQTENLVFAFDSKRNFRKEKHPWYKDRPSPSHILEIKQIVRDQLKIFRTVILPKLGYTNVLLAKGYEGDDAIASAVRTIRDSDSSARIMMASADQDLYQLLGRRIIHTRCSGSGEVLETNASILSDTFHGISHKDWHKVKAIAGCTSDTIPGVDGVAEPTAAAYLMGKITKGKNFEAIDAFVKTKQYKINLSLIKLPYEGCPEFNIEPQTVPSEKCWRSVMKEYGINSLSNEIDQLSARKAIRR